eukprot:TRINITY_DN2646_c0_g1_i1.p1 TRINITY_DN2646_c0_g1~~TRINITY_DN2646_c0_g1_i1.p1  ORF type:complete len:136 (-),score=3.48 TRINITY_DN2646_c0_g1_i1:57-464(-)
MFGMTPFQTLEREHRPVLLKRSHFEDDYSATRKKSKGEHLMQPQAFHLQPQPFSFQYSQTQTPSPTPSVPTPPPLHTMPQPLHQSTHSYIFNVVCKSCFQRRYEKILYTCGHKVCDDCCNGPSCPICSTPVIGFQ